MSAARQQMADNPELQTLMAGLRGSNTGAQLPGSQTISLAFLRAHSLLGSCQLYAPP